MHVLLYLMESMLCTIGFFFYALCCFWPILTHVPDSSVMNELHPIFYFKYPKPFLFCHTFHTLTLFGTMSLIKGHTQADTPSRTNTSFSLLQTESSAEGPNINMDVPQRKTRWPIELFRFNTNLLLCLSSPLAESKGGQALPRCRLCHWR